MMEQPEGEERRGEEQEIRRVQERRSEESDR
jgi:hypothetical protein